MLDDFYIRSLLFWLLWQNTLQKQLKEKKLILAHSLRAQLIWSMKQHNGSKARTETSLSHDIAIMREMNANVPLTFLISIRSVKQAHGMMPPTVVVGLFFPFIPLWKCFHTVVTRRLYLQFILNLLKLARPNNTSPHLNNQHSVTSFLSQGIPLLVPNASSSSHHGKMNYSFLKTSVVFISPNTVKKSKVSPETQLRLNFKPL